MFSGTASRLAILAWTTAWFVFVVPAHQRGAIRVDGGTGETAAQSCESDAESGSCCARGNPSPGEPSKPASDDPVRCCAICKVVAKYGGPEAGVVGPVGLSPVVRMVCERPVDRPVASCVGPDRSRAPPIVA
jgi:hypothetical protein